MDLRLKSVPYELDGKTYQLRCNMAVLMDVQEAFDGDLTQALSRAHSMRGLLEFLAAMLNDYADEMRYVDADGFAIRYTEKQLGRRLSLGTVNRLAPDVMRMAILAVRDAEAENSSADEKNAETRQEEAVVSTSPGI